MLKEAGVKRLIPLKVSGPFHTALLKPASDKLSKVLATVEFTDFKLPLVGNTEATIMEQGRIKELLTRQVMEPVRFYDSIATMKNSGVTDFIEIGPGKVLSGFIKKIDKSMKMAQVEDITSLSVLLEKRNRYGT
ncbi:Malonyl CoA-acyl carrier protein transacylase [Streptococcus sp. BCA20]|nr:Malonyl CoA-acyl carrier protein transacylase [Streptococcus sp. BCA20]